MKNFPTYEEFINEDLNVKENVKGWTDWKSHKKLYKEDFSEDLSESDYDIKVKQITKALGGNINNTLLTIDKEHYDLCTRTYFGLEQIQHRIEFGCKKLTEFKVEELFCDDQANVEIFDTPTGKVATWKEGDEFDKFIHVCIKKSDMQSYVRWLNEKSDKTWEG